jgi:hypothetical protein
VAAAETAIGLAILVAFYRNRGSIAVEDIDLMKGWRPAITTTAANWAPGRGEGTVSWSNTTTSFSNAASCMKTVRVVLLRNIMEEDLSQIVTTLSERSPQQMLAVITSVGQRIFAEYPEFECRAEIIVQLCNTRVFQEMHASNEYQGIIVWLFDKIVVSSVERSKSYHALERVLNEVFAADSEQSILYVHVIDNILPQFIKGPNKIDCILLPTSTRGRSIGQHAALRLRIASLLTSEVKLRSRAEQLQMAWRAAIFFKKNHDNYDEMLGYLYTQGSIMYSDVLADLFRLYLSFGKPDDEHLEYAIDRVTKIADVSKQIRAVHSRSEQQ